MPHARVLRPSFSSLLAGLTVATLLAGCAAGPDFQPPAAPAVETYTAVPLPQRTASAPVAHGAAQGIGLTHALSQRWWEALGSPRLDALIDAALAANPSLAAAEATLRQAQELHAARAGSTRFPQVDARLSAQRQRLNPSSLGQSGEPREFSLLNAGVGVRYQWDLAGGNRRALEALAARADYERHRLEGARLLLAGNIATAAITRARLAAQIEALEAMAQAQEQQLAIARDRLRLGQAAPDEVLALQGQWEGTRAQIPALIQQRLQTEHLLATLAGRAPAAGGDFAFSLADFQLPAELPLIVPSELVRGRPDIRAAEALMHAANAEYGAAVARLYPQIDLSASLGSQALTSGALFGSGTAVWSLLGQLTQPLFNPGLPAEKRAALAAFEAAAANYQQLVLDGLRNVADVLSAVDNDARTLASLAAADGAARASLESVRQRHALGAAGYVEVLVASQQLERNRLNLIAAQAQRLMDSVALYLALGGGSVTENAGGAIGASARASF